ncbi:MAG: Coenzyme F420 hydrogenase/dehydrogenase, beta subunit C-terminal domain [Clostridium sp.]
MNNILKMDINKKCTGCRACESICPKNSIKFIENEEGFLVPSVDENTCINCGICYNKCPQLNDVKIESSYKLCNTEVYASKVKDKSILLESSSGGIFTAIAIKVLENDGVVFGCAFDKNFYARHIGIKQIDELIKLRGSKYVQSDTMKTFLEVKEYLKKNITVLYVGTPCEIAGLRAFLNNKYNNLITIDLICHGVPSPKLFAEYIKNFEFKNNEKLKKYDFRYKGKIGFGKCNRIITDKKIRTFVYQCDYYYKSFNDEVNYRECCYECKYTNTNRIGDITLGDYWGYELLHPEVDSSMGISVVLINSIKGKNIFDGIKNTSLITYNSTLEEATCKQYSLKKSAKRPKSRDGFYKDLNIIGYEKTMKKYIKIKNIVINSILLKINKNMRGKIRRLRNRIKKYVLTVEVKKR